jgi:hypothetical protein
MQRRGGYPDMATMVLDKEKYKDAFLYLLCALGKIEGKKKVCKLFYFLDFDYYESYEPSTTVVSVLREWVNY